MSRGHPYSTTDVHWFSLLECDFGHWSLCHKTVRDVSNLLLWTALCLVITFMHYQCNQQHAIEEKHKLKKVWNNSANVTDVDSVIDTIWTSCVYGRSSQDCVTDALRNRPMLWIVYQNVVGAICTSWVRTVTTFESSDTYETKVSLKFFVFVW